jgi:CRP-like cAMP-binding protein
MSGVDESDRHPELDRKLRSLARCELFGELPPRELRRLARSSVMLRLAKGRPLLEPGQIVSALFLMVEGSVMLYRVGEDGRSVI